MTRSKLITIISVVVFLLSLVYAWMETPRLKKAPPLAQGKKVPAKLSTRQLNEANGGRLRVDLLTHETTAFSGVKRDLFTGAKVTRRRAKVVSPPKPVVVITPPPVLEPIVEKVTVAPITEVVRTQLAQFTFLGYLKKAHQQSIFLIERGDIFVVKQGDHFGQDNQFEVKRIATDKMTILDMGGNLISVSLIEQAPLSMTGRTRRPVPAALSPINKRQPATGTYRHPSPGDDTNSPLPPHMLPPVPSGTNVPPSWHNSPKGIPHE